MLFFNLFNLPCCETNNFLYALDTTYIPLLAWLLLAMAFFDLYLKVRGGKTLSSKKKTVKRKVKRKRTHRKPRKVVSQKPITKQKKVLPNQTQPSRVRRFFARKTEDGYIDMTG